MRRVIVDYAKLTDAILTLLVEKFPEGYDDSNIIRFRNKFMKELKKWLIISNIFKALKIF